MTHQEKAIARALVWLAEANQAYPFYAAAGRMRPEALAVAVRWMRRYGRRLV